ncbi:hypothetical protein CAPTEDRAFT_191093 [Capitella teleta]|uniref:SH3 domain-containing protein n=1 Tax=Capitella teleta TaxID=283909 RepID=R7UK74_CAPTE|nr:hypothetical protein CAPTEDRAFT_191093 [Capitella teleta]|eukprot:ELU06493.1 hypothetical protein CAPTEDRAFT_191093 [Capitella teleta]
MGDDCHGYGLAILLTSGVTCALLVCDLATRYLLRKKEEEEGEEVLVQTQQAAAAPQIAAFGFDPITTEDKELLLGKSEVIISEQAFNKCSEGNTPGVWVWTLPPKIKAKGRKICGYDVNRSFRNVRGPWWAQSLKWDSEQHLARNGIEQLRPEYEGKFLSEIQSEGREARLAGYDVVCMDDITEEQLPLLLIRTLTDKIGFKLKSLEDAVAARDERIAELEKKKDSASKLSTRPKFPPIEDDEGSEVSRTPSGLSYHLNDLVEALRSNVDLTVCEEDLPAELAEKLREIISLKNNCNDISCEFDQLSAHLVRPNSRDNDAEEQQEKEDNFSLTEYQKRNNALKSRWNTVRRLFFCADVHLRNATNYQQFYHEVKEVQHNLRDLHASEKAENDAGKNIKSGEDFEKAVDEYQSLLDTILMWQNIVAELTDKSHAIVPVHKRTEILETPIPVSALCNFKRDDFMVTEGESLVLINNEDQNAWIVRNSEGDEGALPAVCCLIAPPDVAAINTASKLKLNFSALAITTETHLRKTLLQIVREMLKKMIDNKEDYFEVLKTGQKEKIVDLLTQLRGWMEMETTEQTIEEKRTLVDYLDQLDKIITDSSVKGLEYEHLETEVVHVLIKILDLLGIQEDLHQKQKKFRSMSWNNVQEDSLSFDSEWDTLDELDGLQHEKGLGISVQKSTTEVGESSSITSAKGEVRQTFSIKAVMDLRDDSEISMDEAIGNDIASFGGSPVDLSHIVFPCSLLSKMLLGLVFDFNIFSTDMESYVDLEYDIKFTGYGLNGYIMVCVFPARGIINQERGVYKNLLNGEEYPMPVAMNAGFIIVESTQTKKSKEETQAVGVVTVKITRETRPYNITTVLDAETNEHVAVSEAVEKGIFNPQTGKWVNTTNKLEVNAQDAIDMGYLAVEYSADSEEDADGPEVIERTFAIYGVMDRASDKRIPFKDAIDKGIIDENAGMYFDTVAKEKINITEAMGKGWVRARVVTDPSEIEEFMSKRLSGSTDSLNSDTSK